MPSAQRNAELSREAAAATAAAIEKGELAESAQAVAASRSTPSEFCTQRFSPHPEGKLSTIAGRALQAPVDRGCKSFRFSGEQCG